MGAVDYSESDSGRSLFRRPGQVIQLPLKRPETDSTRDERDVSGGEQAGVSAQDSAPETTLRDQLGDWESVKLVITGHPDSIAETARRIREGGINTPDLAGNTVWLVVTMPARLAISLCWWILDHPARFGLVVLISAVAAIAA